MGINVSAEISSEVVQVIVDTWSDEIGNGYWVEPYTLRVNKPDFDTFGEAVAQGATLFVHETDADMSVPLRDTDIAEALTKVINEALAERLFLSIDTTDFYFCDSVMQMAVLGEVRYG